MIRDSGIILKRKYSGREVLHLHDGDLPYFSVPSFDREGIVNAFTTKLGGVSTGYFSSLNLAALKEAPEVIQENYRRVAKVLGITAEKVVLSYQTHTANIRLVQPEDAGKGPFIPRDYVDTDGLITDIPGITLVTLFADCVPLYFYDPGHRAVGLSHAGHRGTVKRIGRETLLRMNEAFGTEASDVIAAIGPSICGDCYEVGPELAEVFIQEFGEELLDPDIPDDKDPVQLLHPGPREGNILRPKPNGKYLLDLAEANRRVLLEAGVPGDRITVTDICTKCNPDLLYSHRVMGEKRGVQGAFLGLPEV